MLATKHTARRFGFECEIARGARPVLALLADRGLAGSATLHSYHCDCDICDPFRRRFPIHGQQDCTVDGELITKVLEFGSDEADTTFTGLAQALREGRGEPGIDAGFHVHVDRTDLDNGGEVRLLRMFLRYQDDLAELAQAASSAVRPYNHRLSARNIIDSGSRRRFTGRYDNDGYPIYEAEEPAVDWWSLDPDDDIAFQRVVWPAKGDWLARREETYEFRLWNSTRSEFRMRLAVGVSVALVNAAADGVNVTEHDERSLIDVLAPYLDPTTFASLIRQAHYVEETF